YEPLVREVFRDEDVAVSLGERRVLTELAAARSAVKLLDAALSSPAREGRNVRVRALVSLLKSDYFSLAPPRAPIVEQTTFSFDDAPSTEDDAIDGDDVENAVAYVGADLALDDWLRRAQRLIVRLSGDDRLERLLDDQEPPSEDDKELRERRIKPARVRANFP